MWSKRGRMPVRAMRRRPRERPQGTPTPLPPALRQTLNAAVERLIPSEPGSPGAREARVEAYFEQALSEDLHDVAATYAFNLELLEHHARSFYERPFPELQPTDQDALLTRLEANELAGFEPDSASFFRTLLRHTVEGMFGDPSRGGNHRFAGWDLISAESPASKPVLIISS